MDEPNKKADTEENPIEPPATPDSADAPKEVA